MLPKRPEKWSKIIWKKISLRAQSLRNILDGLGNIFSDILHSLMKICSLKLGQNKIKWVETSSSYQVPASACLTGVAKKGRFDWEVVYKDLNGCRRHSESGSLE